jgi:RimJ/RimL family protein N-acetyltransferase
VIFGTERLRVREWTDDDAPAVLAIYSREEVWRWLGPVPAPTATLADARARVARWSARGGGDPAYGVWAVTLASGEVVGTVLLVPLEGGDDEVEVGWHLHPRHWGHGYATEAARGALDYGLALGLAEVFAVVDPDNHPSLAVARRLGMTDLGLSRRFYARELRLFRATPPVPRGRAS